MLIEFNGKGVYVATGVGSKQVMFQPGVNEVAAEDFELLRASEMFRARLDRGELVVKQDDRPRGVEGPKDMGFTGLSHRDALEQARRTSDPEVLRRWIDQERAADKPRPKVLDLLEERLTAVTLNTPKAAAAGST